MPLLLGKKLRDLFGLVKVVEGTSPQRPISVFEENAELMSGLHVISLLTK